MNIIDDYISFHINPKCLLTYPDYFRMIEKKKYIPKHFTERAIHPVFEIVPS